MHLTVSDIERSIESEKARILLEAMDGCAAVVERRSLRGVTFAEEIKLGRVGCSQPISVCSAGSLRVMGKRELRIYAPGDWLSVVVTENETSEGGAS